MSSPAPGSFVVPLEKPFNFAHIRQLLKQSFNFRGCTPRIECLIGTVSTMRLLAALYMRARPLDDELSAIRVVFTTSAHLSTRTKDLIGSTFSCGVFEFYGISEISAAVSAECSTCGAFHMPPIVVPEVVDFYDDHQPISRGLGELVLTSLVPYSSLQPLIRYRTGDIVEIMPSCERVDDLGFRIRGRVSESVIDKALGVILASGDVFEIIDAFPDVERSQFGPAVRFDLDHAFGNPKFRIAHQNNGINGQGIRHIDITIELELRYHPNMFPQRVNEVKKEITEKILHKSSIACSLIESNQLTLTIHTLAPGALEDSKGAEWYR